MRLTDLGSGEGHNTGLKTGVLFPGCIYGVCGAEQPSREFIRSFKEVIRSLPMIDPPSAWQAFTEHSTNYNYDRSHPNSRFTMLLSERSTGQPIFYVLDSSNGCIAPKPKSSPDEIEALPFGSGADIMQRTFHTEFLAKTNKFLEFVGKEGGTPKQAFEIFPYIFCLWLNEYSLGENRYELEKCGVGGPFHFIYQNGQNESRQGSAWTVVVSVDDQGEGTHSIATLHKIVPLSVGVGVQTYDLGSEEPRGYQTNFCLSGAADYEWNEPPPEKAQLLADEFGAAQKQAAFCGIGFAQRRYRNRLIYLVECFEKDLFDEEGSPDAWVKQAVIRAIQMAH